MTSSLMRWLLCLVVWLACACEHYDQPSEPVWNKQPCAHCHMLVSDPRFAAQLVTRSHERRYFDDPGCLAAYMHERAQEVEHAWVRDESGWRAARYARFRRGERSPMGYDFVASTSGDLDFSAVQEAASARHKGVLP